MMLDQIDYDVSLCSISSVLDLNTWGGFELMNRRSFVKLWKM